MEEKIEPTFADTTKSGEPTGEVRSLGRNKARIADDEVDESQSSTESNVPPLPKRIPEITVSASAPVTRTATAKTQVRHHEAKRTQTLDALLVEIFELTGYKVTIDDPILIAALFQSNLVKRAGDDAANSLQNAAVKIVAELTEAVKVEREQAAKFDRTMATAFQQIADGAKTASDNELTLLRTRFASIASETLDQIRKEASRQTPSGLWWKSSAILLGGVVVGLLIGTVVGMAKAPKIPNEQVRLMHNGMLLDAAWSKLPKASRELIEASGQSDAKPNAEKAGNGKK